MEGSSWENHLFLWAIYTMAMLNKQRVAMAVMGHELILLTMQNRLVLKATFSATKRRSWLGKKLVRFLFWTNLIVAISTKQSKISNVRLEKKRCNITKIPDFALRQYLPGLILLWSLGAILEDHRSTSPLHINFRSISFDYILYANVYCILKNII